MPPEEENRLAWQLGQQHAYGTEEWRLDQQYNQHLANEAADADKKARENNLANQQAPSPPSPHDPPPPPVTNENTGNDKKQQRRKVKSKALFLTVPLAFIPFAITYSAPGHASQHLPLWQSVLFAVLIAAIGMPKWRARAAGLLVVALIVSWILGS